MGACAFSLQPISLHSLRSVLFFMKNSSVPGSDGVSTQILRLCFDAIGHVLFYFVNICLTTCEFPDSWKHSIIHPIHKSGNPSDASNYRPISIVPAFAKLVEKVAQQQLYTYMSGNYLFSSSSTVSAPVFPQKPRLPPYPTTSFPPPTARNLHSPLPSRPFQML